MAQNTFDPIQDALDRLRWMRDMQSQRAGERGVGLFDQPAGIGDQALIDAIEGASRNLAALQNSARQSGNVKQAEQIAAEIGQSQAQTGYLGAQTSALNENTRRLQAGELTPEQQASNQIAGRQVGVAEAQNRLAQSRLDFDERKAEIEEAYRNKQLTFEQAKLQVQQAENALSREIQWYQAETQRIGTEQSNQIAQRGQDITERGQGLTAGLTQRGQDIQFEQGRQTNELAERGQNLGRRASDIGAAFQIADRTTSALEKARGYTVPKGQADAFYGALQQIHPNMPNMSSAPMFDPRTIVGDVAAEGRQELSGYQVPGPTRPMQRPGMRFNPMTGQFEPEVQM